MVVRFDDNACALIGKNGEPLGTRINGESDLGVPAVYTFLGILMRHICPRFTWNTKTQRQMC